MKPMGFGVGPKVGCSMEPRGMGCDIEPMWVGRNIEPNLVRHGVELVDLLSGRKVNTEFHPYNVIYYAILAINFHLCFISCKG